MRTKASSSYMRHNLRADQAMDFFQHYSQLEVNQRSFGGRKKRKLLTESQFKAAAKKHRHEVRKGRQATDGDEEEDERSHDVEEADVGGVLSFVGAKKADSKKKKKKQQPVKAASSPLVVTGPSSEKLSSALSAIGVGVGGAQGSSATVRGSLSSNASAAAAGAVSSGVVVTAGDSETYFSLEVVIAGASKGTALSGARRHLGTLTSLRDRNKLTSEIQCFEHCARLAPDRLPKATVVEIQNDITEARNLCSVVIPLSVLAFLTQKWIDHLIASEKFDLVADAVCPWLGEEGKPFDVKNPTVGALAIQYKGKEDVAILADCIRNSYFGDASCSLFADPPSQGS
jgi:hypothetical protein